MSQASRQKSERNADTRERLLHTALALYAQEGLHAVSLRRISAESGSKNSAAMHYHFENQLGVLCALMQMITRELRDMDTALRDDSGTPRTLREACRDIITPLVMLPQRQPWGNDALRFLSRLMGVGMCSKRSQMFSSNSSLSIYFEKIMSLPTSLWLSI